MLVHLKVSRSYAEAQEFKQKYISFGISYESVPVGCLKHAAQIFVYIRYMKMI